MLMLNDIGSKHHTVLKQLLKDEVWVKFREVWSQSSAMLFPKKMD